MEKFFALKSDADGEGPSWLERFRARVARLHGKPPQQRGHGKRSWVAIPASAGI